MYGETDRRMFVRNMAVGLPAFAGVVAWSPAAAATPTGLGRDRMALAAIDTRIDRTLRDMANFYNQLAGKGITPADARAIAPQFRSLATYRRGSGRDLELSGAMRELIAREGRQRLAAIEPDLTPLQRGLEYYGVRGSGLTLGRIDATARSLAIEKLAREGAASYFEDSWVLVEVFGELAQSPDFCDFIQDMMRILEAMAAMFCVASVFAPVFGPECLASSVVLSILKFVSFVESC